MNQLTVRRLLTWLLVLLIGLLASQVDASNRERIERQHHQQLNRSHHHKRNNGPGARRTASTTTTATPELTTVTDSPTHATTPPGALSYRHRMTTHAEVPKTMIAVKASLNGNIFMRCPTEDMNDDFQVSWVRLPDWRIVASGRRIYNKDERFRVLHIEGTTEWTLQIKRATLIDEGLYECQVSTATGIVTHYYNVTVIVPTTTIVGGSEYHVDKGSAIQLTCVIHNIPQEPQFIFWYHNERMINYDSMSDAVAEEDHDIDWEQRRLKIRHRPRVEVLTETDRPARDDEAYSDEYQDRIVYSQLTIHDVTDADSGNYTCSPSNAEPASMLVFVSEGDDAAAAIQVGETNVSDAVLNLPGSGSASSAIAANSSSVRTGELSLYVLLSCLSVARYLAYR